RYCFSLEVANCVHALCPKQFEAPGMHPSQQLDLCVRIDLDDIIRDEAHAHVDLVGPNRSVDRIQWNFDILDVIEALDFEQPFRPALWRNTKAGSFGKADGRSSRRGLLSRPRFTANQGYGCSR